MSQATAPVPVEELNREELLVYARQLARQGQKERQGLQRALAQRERQIQQASATSIAAQDRARQWVAIDLHDRVAQTLVAISQQLQILESSVEADSAVKRVATHAAVLIREAIAQTRSIMHELHPAALDELGLAALIYEELVDLEHRKRCRMRFEAHYPERAVPEVEVGLYRIFHEALINVTRHVELANVAVTLTCTEHLIRVQVEDDGPGFDLREARRRHPVGGLLSMWTRAEALGGTLEVMCIPGLGTTVKASIPEPYVSRTSQGQ